MSRAEKIRVAAILAAGYALFLAYAAPGFMSIDSAQQLLQARAHSYDNWHPPAMAWLWGIVEHVVRGPLPMLLLQSGTLFAGIFLILHRVFTPTRAAIIACLIFLFPVVIAPMAVIWKDSQMAGYLLLGFALLFGRFRIAGLVLLALGCAMRHNAPAAALPLLFVIDWGGRRLTRVAIIAGLFVAITGSATLLNKHLTDRTAYPWHTALAPFDIGGVMKYGRAFRDDEMLRILDGTPLVPHDHIAATARRIYSPTNWWPLLNGSDRLFNWPENPTQRAAIERAWKELVWNNKRAYLHHRIATFIATLGLDGEPLFAPLWYGEPNDEYKHALDLEAPAEHRVAIGKALEWLAVHTVLFRPYLYFFLAIIGLVLARKQLDLVALYASGLIYELTLLPFGSADVRYSHWLVVTMMLATVILVRRRMTRA
ncbi:MAG TPA: hypothetical protein VGC41_20700 [Kofleriaceae bacterium]